MHTLGGEQLDESILDITNIASNVRQQNLANVMNKSNFFGKQSATKIDFFSNDRVEQDIESQIKILISCIEDKDELTKMYHYWSNLKNSPDYNEEMFLTDLINNKVSQSSLCLKKRKKRKGKGGRGGSDFISHTLTIK